MNQIHRSEQPTAASMIQMSAMSANAAEVHDVLSRSSNSNQRPPEGGVSCQLFI